MGSCEIYVTSYRRKWYLNLLGTFFWIEIFRSALDLLFTIQMHKKETYNYEIGAWLISNICRNLVKANESPPNLKGEKLALQYYIKLKKSRNPGWNTTLDQRYRHVFQRKEKAMKNFWFRMEAMIQEIEKTLSGIPNRIIPNILAWSLRIPEINLILCKSHKTRTHSYEELDKSKSFFPHTHTSSQVDQNTKMRQDVKQCKPRKYKRNICLKRLQFSMQKICAIDLAHDFISRRKN